MPTPTFDPITLQSILQSLPEIQKRQQRAKRLRQAEDYFTKKAQEEGDGNYQPRQQGGLYPTVQQYRTDYKALGNQLVGGIGQLFASKMGDTAELENQQRVNPEILRTVEQIGQVRDGQQVEGSPAEGTLRAYLGMLGGPDYQDIVGKQAHVSSTKTDENGNIVLVMSDGRQIETGRKADYSGQIVTGEDGKQIIIGKSGAGRGKAADVTYGGGNPLAPGGSASMPFGGAGGTPSPATTNIDGLSPEQNQILGQLLSSMPADRQEAFMSRFMDGLQSDPAAVAGAAAPQAGQVVRVPTKAQEAGSAEAAKIQAQLAAAPQTAQAAAAEQGMKTSAELQAKARMDLPKMQSSINLARSSAQQLLNHPGLKQIVGGVGGRIPDGPTAMKYFNAVMAGTPAADAMALHNQIKGEVFLQAYNTLKGGGQITEIEGQKAEQAMARMDRAQSIESYKKAVGEFVQAMESGYKKLEAAATGGVSAPAAAPQRPALPPGFSWED